MNKYDFLKRLDNTLSPLSKDERDNALKFYEEFINDCENWDEAQNKLDEPEVIGEQILRENGIITDTKEENKGFKISTSAIIIAILTFPFWIGFVAAAFGILVAIIAVIFALLVASGAIVVGFIVGGIIMLLESVSVGLIMIGLGLIAVGICSIGIIPLAKFLLNSMKSTLKKFINFVKGLFRKKAGV